MSFKSAKSNILMIGERKNELGGSLFYDIHNELGANIPTPDLNEAKKQIYAITDCINQSLFYACHDISDGGIAVALSEMTFGNSIGIDVHVDGDISMEKILFSETGGFVVEVDNKNIQKVENILKSYELNYSNIGKTTSNSEIKMNDVINLSLGDAKELWSNGLRNKLK